MDAKGQWRSATLQGCPREVRLVLASAFCHDVDLINSLPTVASQLDRLGLCPSEYLVELKDYVANRQAWFDMIIDGHAIPVTTGLNTEAKDVAKALPIRPLHGGTYAGWVREFGVASCGVDVGRPGLPKVARLAWELRHARRAVVEALQCEGEEWVRVALAAAEAKEAAGRPLASLPQWRREQVWEKARSSVFALVLQDKEDECLMVALRSLEADGWLVHSLQQDGLLVEAGRRVDGSPAVPLKKRTDPDGAIARAERAIEAAKGLSLGLAEKPFFESTEVPAVIARFALPGTVPVPMPLPRADVASRPWRRTAAQVTHATALEAGEAARRRARAVDEAHGAVARNAETEAAAWEARCVEAAASVELARARDRRRAVELATLLEAQMGAAPRRADGVGDGAAEADVEMAEALAAAAGDAGAEGVGRADAAGYEQDGLEAAGASETYDPQRLEVGSSGAPVRAPRKRRNRQKAAAKARARAAAASAPGV